MMDMIIRSAKLDETGELFDIGIESGIFRKISPRIEYQGKEEIDAGGNFVSSPFLDPHVHLDMALTLGRPRYNKSGELLEAIALWTKYKDSFLSPEDLKQRAFRAIYWEISRGTLMIRAHVDVSDERLMALKAMLEIRDKVRDLVNLQIVAFPQDGVFGLARGQELLEEALKLGADIVGGIPHNEWTREDGVRSLEVIFNLAKQYDRPIDVHCDETDDEQSRFLEVLAAKTIREDYEGRVTASHTTAMHSYNNAYASKIFGLLRRAKINIICNPFSNTVLQGRFDTYPKRRGVTRVKELLANEINVCLGHDSIMDACYPLGCGDMLQAAQLTIHVCQMTGYEEMMSIYETITKNSAVTFGITKSYGIKEGNPADLVVLDAKTILDALRLIPPRLFIVKAGHVISKSNNLVSQISSHGKTWNVDYGTSQS